MIPQNPMFVIKNKKNDKYMNASTGTKGTGPATVFKDAKRISSFCHFYASPETDFKIREVELVTYSSTRVGETKD